MRLANLAEFRALYFTPSSAPTMETLRSRIRADKIPGGKKRGNRYYVDLDEFERAEKIRDTARAEQRELEQEPLLQGLV